MRTLNKAADFFLYCILIRLAVLRKPSDLDTKALSVIFGPFDLAALVLVLLVLKSVDYLLVKMLFAKLRVA